MSKSEAKPVIKISVLINLKYNKTDKLKKNWDSSMKTQTFHSTCICYFNVCHKYVDTATAVYSHDFLLLEQDVTAGKTLLPQQHKSEE